MTFAVARCGLRAGDRSACKILPGLSVNVDAQAGIYAELMTEQRIAG